MNREKKLRHKKDWLSWCWARTGTPPRLPACLLVHDEGVKEQQEPGQEVGSVSASGQCRVDSAHSRTFKAETRLFAAKEISTKRQCCSSSEQSGFDVADD